MAYFVLLGVTEGMWVARIPGLKAALHLTDGLLGASLLVGPAGLVAIMPLAGRLADHFGSARLSRSAAAAVAVLPVFLWTAGTLAEVLVTVLAFGVAGGLMAVGLNAQAVRVEQACGRPLMASFHAAFSLGGLAGALLGGLVAWRQAAPAAPARAVALAGIAATAVAVALIAGRWLVPDRNQRRRAVRPCGLPGPDWAARGMRCAVGMRSALGVRCAAAVRSSREGPSSVRLTGLGLLALCCLVAEGAVANWSGVYLRSDLGAPRGYAAAGFAAFSLAMAGGRLAGDRLTARYGPVGLVRGCGLLASAGLAGALCTHTPVGAVIGFAVCGGGLSCTVPQFLSAAGHADPQRPGRGIARVARLGYVGLVGGPALIGGCASLAGLPAALAIPVALGVCVALFAALALDPAGVSGRDPAPPAGS